MRSKSQEVIRRRKKSRLDNGTPPFGHWRKFVPSEGRSCNFPYARIDCFKGAHSVDLTHVSSGHSSLRCLLSSQYRPAGTKRLRTDAQRKAIADYLNGGAWELVGEFTEVESGKKSERPELARAMDACRKHKARLVIAKLDRLSRNLAFIATLMESGVEFVAADMPFANKLTIHILAAVAEMSGKPSPSVPKRRSRRRRRAGRGLAIRTLPTP